MDTQPLRLDGTSAGDITRRVSDLSRRTFLGGLSGAAALGMAARAGAQQGQVPTAGQAGGLRRRDDLLTLVNRASNGFNLNIYAEAQTVGYDAWLEAQLDWENIDNTAVDQILLNLPSLAMSGKELYDNYGTQVEQAIFELDIALVIRALFSGRQLHERMVEFWSDHFSMFHFNPVIDLLKTVDDREVIRTHALGRFPDLLHASARSGAMMVYLDNYLNFVGAPNENYARELMELHTLGVDGGYTETDVEELSRALTGWTFNGDVNSPQYGEHLFYAPNHDDGSKLILGQYLPPGGGAFDVNFMLTYLAGHPSTAQFLSKKLCNWLLMTDTPQSIVDATAAAYMSTGGDIKAMVRVILSQQALRLARPHTNPKIRRPYHFLMSLMRATYPDISDVFPMLIQLNNMGHLPFTWPAPNGFPDAVGAWGSDILPRWELASTYFNNQFPGATVSDQTLVALIGGDLNRPDLAQGINEGLAGGGLSAEDVAEVQAFIDSQTLLTGTLREAFALAASAPSFQLF